MLGPAIALAALVALAPACAQAADIPRLEGTITDQVGVIGDRSEEVLAALDAVRDKQGVQVFVLFVRSTQEMTVTEFVDETARVNSLGADDALVVVATDDRTDAVWVSDSLPITDQELNQIIAGTLEPALRDGDFANAAIAAAEALGAAAQPVPPPTAGPAATFAPETTATPIPGASGTDRGAGDLVTLVGIVLLGLGIVVIAVWLVGRVAGWRETGERNRRLARLARDANAQLIAADDRIRAADQETGFVEAEFGETEAAPFRAAVDDARRELRAAFALRQRLDDGDPEDPPTRESMLTQIVEGSRRANAALDGEAARLEELRSLERDAPTILAGLPGQLEPIEARLPAAERALAGFAAYAPAAWAAVKGNAEEARKGLAGARAAVGRGTEVLATDRSRAAREIGVAQRGIAGAAALLDAIDKLGATLSSASEGLSQELVAAERDIVDARAAIRPAATPAAGEGAADSGTASLGSVDLVAAEHALSTARAAANATPLDPLDAARLATAARRAAAEVLAAARRDAEQAQRFAAAVDSSIVAARAEVDRAADFIATRRTGVRRQARTRLVEAERLLDDAVAIRPTDPKGAMAQAQRADTLASEAYALASTDFDRWDSGRRGPGTGSDLAGAVLGGIMGGILSGGGRGGGWGGSPWGSPGPFGGGGLGGGSWGGGGWGGGHSAGGGFGGFGGSGGGGGHSSGGRW